MICKTLAKRPFNCEANQIREVAEDLYMIDPMVFNDSFRVGICYEIVLNQVKGLASLINEGNGVFWYAFEPDRPSLMRA